MRGPFTDPRPGAGAVAVKPEITWTPPKNWCPHPEYWHAEDDEATEVEVTELVSAFVRALQPELVVETGTYDGQTAEAIGKALQANGHGRLVTIEIKDTLVEMARDRCAGLPVEVFHGSSLDWLLGHESTVGFAWLDSGQIRHQELELLFPRLASGGVVGIHDAAPHHAVYGFVEPVVKRLGMSEIRLRTPRGVLFLQGWT